MQNVQIPFDGGSRDFELDLGSKHWSEVGADAIPPLTEGEFPLIGESDGKRYELYSDGTFAEVER